MFSCSMQKKRIATKTPFSNKREIELKDLLSNFALPQVVEIVNGYHGVDETTTLTVGQVLTICTLATTDVVHAKDSDNNKLYIPLNCATKLELCTQGGEEYSSVWELAQASPKFARVIQGNTSKKKEKRLNVGDKLQLKRITRTGTVLECDNQKRDRLRLPVSLEARFQPLADGKEYVLRDILKSHQLPVWVHFLGTRRGDVAESSASNFESLGVLKLERTVTEEHFVCLSEQGNERCMLTVPKETDIRVKVIQQSARKDDNCAFSDKAFKMEDHEQLTIEDIYLSRSGIKKYPKRKSGVSQTVEKVGTHFVPPLSREETADPENIYASLEETGDYAALVTTRIDTPEPCLGYSPKGHLQSAKSSGEPADVPITKRSVNMVEDLAEVQGLQEGYEYYVSMNEEHSQNFDEKTSASLGTDSLENRGKMFIFPETPPQPSPRTKSYSIPFDTAVKGCTKSDSLCFNYDKENVPFPCTENAEHGSFSGGKYCQKNHAKLEQFLQPRVQAFSSENLVTRLPLAVKYSKRCGITHRHYSTSSIENTSEKDSRIKTIETAKQASLLSAHVISEPANDRTPRIVPRHSSCSTAEQLIEQKRRNDSMISLRTSSIAATDQHTPLRQRQPLPLPRTVKKSTNSVTGLSLSIRAKDIEQLQPCAQGAQNRGDIVPPSPLPRTKRFSCSSAGELSLLNEFQQPASSESSYPKTADVTIPSVAHQKRKLSESVFENENPYESMDNCMERRKLVETEVKSKTEKKRLQNDVPPALTCPEEQTFIYECMTPPEKPSADSLSTGPSYSKNAPVRNEISIEQRSLGNDNICNVKKPAEALISDVLITNHVSSMSMADVSEFLRTYRLGEFAETFEMEHIDGQMLVELDQDALQALGMNVFQAKKLAMLVKGWRPKTS